MKRLSFLPLALLLVSTAFAQTNPTDSDTLKALLTEVRLLRHDLQTTTVAAQRAQILVYRAQAQESVVRRVQERVDDTRSKLAQTRFEEKRLSAAAKQKEQLRLEQAKLDGLQDQLDRLEKLLESYERQK